ncbi:MAG: hypothetical protein QM813_25505 [Verrucomicrobiota bacterium]
MPSPLQSIRWRFALWLAFLLTLVLAGFGITAYQLHSNNQFNQLDDELKSRAAAISAGTPFPSRPDESWPARFWSGWWSRLWPRQPRPVLAG